MNDANLHTIRIHRALMPTVRERAAARGLTPAGYLATVVEGIVEDSVDIRPVDRSFTRIDFAVSESAWQKALRIAAVLNYRSIGDLVEARISAEP